jgi:DnaK suppressor protein
VAGNEETSDALNLAEVETRLREEQAELRERIGELARPPERGSQVSFGKRIGDGTTEAISRLTEVGVHANLVESERRVSRALEKIADGTYGTCDSCGAAIPAGRLRAVPQSVLCVECARAERPSR